LLFRFDAFASVPKADWQGSELRQAMVLASAVARHLQQDPRFTCEELIQEDFGAVLPVIGPGGKTHVTIFFHPRDDRDDFGWALDLSHRRPLLRAILGLREDEVVVEPVREAIAALVAAGVRHLKTTEE